MGNQFVIYVVDVETTGLEISQGHEIIELSMYRLSDNIQRTWCLKPANYKAISEEALRVNKHKLEDLKHQTKFGKETYIEPNKVLIEIENWMMEDGVAPEQRILCGQNISFDLGHLQALWAKAGDIEMFPFGKRPLQLDTKQIALFLDLAEGKYNNFYGLGYLIERYGIKNAKAHSAAADALATTKLLQAQLQHARSLSKDPL